jgi:exonuclease-1
MGVQGLLPLLKSITSQVHVGDLRHLRAGIDAHCWLHRALHSCELPDPVKYIEYCVNLINMLLRHEVTPIMVFDGVSLPAKSHTSEKRRGVREQYKMKAEVAEKNGFFADAESYRRKAMVITDDIVLQLIQKLKELHIDYVISPYEADAQLAYMSLRGFVDVVITEDSDTLVYGCQRVIFKLSSSGYGNEILRKDLGKNQLLDFSNWTDIQFKMFCCLAGCDYVPRIKNIGIKTAYKISLHCKTFKGLIDYLKSHKEFCDELYLLQVIINTICV